MSDPNRKTQRSFYCRDNLWDLFEVMARDLGCSMDYLLNEAMRHYAQSRNYSLDAGHPAPPPVVAPSASAMPAAPPPPPAAPPPVAMPSGFVRAAAPPVLGNSNDYHRGFEHRTFERLPAAPPPAPPSAPALTTSMNAIAPSAAYQAASAPSSGQFQAAHLAASPQFPTGPVPSVRQGPPPPPPKTITAPMPPGFIDLDDEQDLLPPPPPPPPAPPGFDQRPHSFSAHPTLAAAPAIPMPAPPPPAFDQRPPSFASHPAAPAPKAAPQSSGGQGQLSLIFNGQRYPIAKDKFIVGRASQITDLTIRDGNVSRQHCAVIQRGGQYFIKDLESTNGIEYQGVRIDSKKIDEGDVFNICEYVMRFTFR